jgi:hypothetical protein
MRSTGSSAQTLGAVNARIAYGSPIVRGDGFHAEVMALLDALVAAHLAKT